MNINLQRRNYLTHKTKIILLITVAVYPINRTIILSIEYAKNEK